MSEFFNVDQRVHLRTDPSQWGYIGTSPTGALYDLETRSQDVFWEHAGADIVSGVRVDDLMDVEEYHERRRLFFSAMRHPEMRWVREAFKHLKYDKDIDWHTIKEIEIDPPWDHPWDMKSSWMMNTDAFVTLLLDPKHYDGIEDFTTIPHHDENNEYCECYYCYDATLAKRNLAHYFTLIGENLALLKDDIGMDLSTIHEVEFFPGVDGRDWWMHFNSEIYANVWMDQGKLAATVHDYILL